MADSDILADCQYVSVYIDASRVFRTILYPGEELFVSRFDEVDELDSFSHTNDPGDHIPEPAVAVTSTRQRQPESETQGAK